MPGVEQRADGLALPDAGPLTNLRDLPSHSTLRNFLPTTVSFRWASRRELLKISGAGIPEILSAS